MILVDANILLYAEDALHPRNQEARLWWDAQLSGTEPVCLCWTVLSSFIRIATNPRVFDYPLSIEQAAIRVKSWLDQPCTRLIRPTERHWDIFQKMLIAGQAVANLVTDAHLAALSIEHGCALASTDSDFSRFPEVKWTNPLSPKRTGQ
ncbi:MAG TPA: type II toxin-antitoxin system VapC family toxin [Desulfobacteraceae bacterium]|nr:MAG: type II toxin-antitoxin system VapC family toxin [Deltaproteobacteria bacterium]HDZ24024.1 type II toxin-antitoxin system VapC family toxin [Desulfobacteraceae bacterium]